MITNTKETKILLYGNIGSTSYRSHILIKYLQDSGYQLLQTEINWYRGKRIIKYLSRIIDLSSILCLIELFIKAAVTDIIFMPPGNTRRIKNAVWAARLFNKKLIVEVHTSLYDSFVRDKKLIKDGSREAKEMLKKDILALTEPDYIIHPSACELNYWEKFLGINIDKQKVLISPLCHVSPTSLRRSYMQDGVLKICWWGTFIPLHGIDKILQAMRILQKQEVQFKCNLFGIDSPSFYEYEAKIKQDELEQHVVVRKDLTFADGSLPNYLADNCDLALGIFGSTEKAYHAVPNKLIEALSMGIPTLTMNSPALQEFFNPKIDFWTCNPSQELIAESILAIINGTAYPVDWQQTRQKVLRTFSVTHYQEVVGQVLGRATNNLSVGENQLDEYLI